MAAVCVHTCLSLSGVRTLAFLQHIIVKLPALVPRIPSKLPPSQHVVLTQAGRFGGLMLAAQDPDHPCTH